MQTNRPPKQFQYRPRRKSVGHHLIKNRQGKLLTKNLRNEKFLYINVKTAKLWECIHQNLLQSNHPVFQFGSWYPLVLLKLLQGNCSTCKILFRYHANLLNFRYDVTINFAKQGQNYISCCKNLQKHLFMLHKFCETAV